ncbi:peptidase S8 [Kribbella antibiotica]|uniref:Peptidase S8 n=1 Tax=Kribbella antibiotica TaxID=190195 RepID=A0A4R4ZNF1_9ACTN|nr:S8 family serine peptidase [Kribbella antibiotica]TDD60373.1 peptidase S8 [Kribbella antibiotica]
MRHKLSTAAAAATALALAISALPVMPAAAQSIDGMPKAAVSGWIALPTGDQVAVNTAGKPIGVRRAPGREQIPLQLSRDRGHTFVIPLDAARLVDSGRVDRRLFDVTLLSRPEYVASRRKGVKLIVAYDGGGQRAAAARTFPRINADAVTAPDWNQLTRTTTQGPSAFREVAEGIKKVWLDGVRKASLDKSVPQIGGPAAWAAGFNGKGTKIAVLDTGVDETHPDLAGQEIGGKNFTDSGDKDMFGHGTHVASIAAGTGAKSKGKYKGVAPGAKILDVKVLGDEGSGDDSAVIGGMEWAAAQGADVINMSLGGTDTPGIDPLEEAVNRLSAQTGTLFVIAAGNDGEGGARTVGSPGSADAALTVGAVDKSDKLAPFSSTGPRVGDGGLKPDVTAPGVDIGAAAAPGNLIGQRAPKPADGYMAISGTSMATPHVAGAAAILAQQHPDWTGDQIKAALTGSTVGGAGYSAFQQGTGRIDLRKAIKQSVIVKDGPLSFGTQQWPHTDDKPLSRKITYRNLGKTPVTLDLSATTLGPDGKPAPVGFFTLGAKQLTIPAGGEASTTLTANSKLGGKADGFYSAYVTATGGDQSVRTVAAIEREVESYDVAVSHLGRDGKPAKAYSTFFDGLTGPAKDQRLFLAGPAVSMRLPAGRYLLSSTIFVSPDLGDWKGADWINQPVLQVGKAGKITVDARTAKPVSVTVPDPKAVSQFILIDAAVTTAGTTMGRGWMLESFAGFRTAHLGPKAKAGELNQQVRNQFANGDSLYSVAGANSGTSYLTGYTQRVAKKDLAKVVVRLGASAPGKQGFLIPQGEVDGVGTFDAAYDDRLPRTVTVYLTTARTKWAFGFGQVGAAGTEAEYFSDTKAYQPGTTTTEDFNIGVAGPKLAKHLGLFRDGDKISGWLPLLADGAGHLGGSEHEKASTTLYRNGVKIGSNDDPLLGKQPFTVPAGPADYRLTATITRSAAVAATSSKVSITWGFRSGHTTARTKLPASVVRFHPSLGLDSKSKAGATVKIPVTVEGAKPKSLTVDVSTDGGKHWSKAAVVAGKITVKNPAPGGSISLRAHVVDQQNNWVDQTILKAYLV